MKIYAVISGKGGVAKTTTSIALAAAAHGRKKKVLLVDTDPQGGASYGCGVDPSAFAPERTIIGVLDGSLTPDRAAVRVAEGFSILAAPPRLGPYVESRAGQRDLLTALRTSSADVIIVDSAPGFGTLVQSAVTVADHVILAVLAEPLAVRGAEQSLGLLDGLGASDRLSGVVLTMYQPRLALTKDQREEVERQAAVIAAIPKAVAAAEASLAARSVIAHAPKSPAAKAYLELAETLAL